MHLYEINTEMAWLNQELEVDEETGEILATSDDIIARLDQLSIQKTEILQYLAKVVLDYRAEAAMLKAEEERLNARRKRLERKDERLLQVLDRECGGCKTNLGVATLSYTTSARVEVSNAEKAVNWLKRHKLKECIRVKPPEIDKTAVKRLLKDGTTVPGLELQSYQSCSLK